MTNRQEEILKSKGYTLLYSSFENLQDAKKCAAEYRSKGKKARVDRGDSFVGIHTYYVWHTGI
jgi:hypothetical protein